MLTGRMNVGLSDILGIIFCKPLALFKEVKSGVAGLITLIGTFKEMFSRDFE